MKKRLNAQKIDKKANKKVKAGSKPRKAGSWGYPPTDLFVEKVASNKWRFTSKIGNKKIEAFSSTGKIRSPITEPKVKSQSWRFVKKKK
jgi:hypothetical protein